MSGEVQPTPDMASKSCCKSWPWSVEGCVRVCGIWMSVRRLTAQLMMLFMFGRCLALRGLGVKVFFCLSFMHTCKVCRGVLLHNSE